MTWRTAALSLLLALPLGALMAAINWQFKGTPFSAQTVWLHSLVALLAAAPLLAQSVWLRSMLASGRWPQVAAGGQMRFLLLHGAIGRGGPMLAFVLGMEWLGSGRLPLLNGSLFTLAFWMAFGAYFASRDWRRLQRAAMENKQ
ncbi:hypothetical protein KIF53_02975 [Chromobacterium subtsugae]|uniref:Transmembrane protein n=1 Tax=Chromobacterium subtsugae TaxID=251747 RepID=A0ABS7F924_9NEIS|nr:MULTISPECIES: hypothetical protein [Chromobacterium]KUM04464.1 hypothetical protein Cv017_14345 [Chromobacterium subtsugae]KZE86096.1 hypothetical protein AWB61_17630 [Chromobacterium sp. F49]MBW7564880.1 hypothetical protein [Chromobacterium subtsugae]MBW8286593.1 hypothetical protein [Chromobacterium subtsugae]OBU85058.1 hypothetical protein MY55_18820 [Chromobacterium subtsugae]